MYLTYWRGSASPPPPLPLSLLPSPLPLAIKRFFQPFLTTVIPHKILRNYLVPQTHKHTPHSHIYIHTGYDCKVAGLLFCSFIKVSHYFSKQGCILVSDGKLIYKILPPIEWCQESDSFRFKLFSPVIRQKGESQNRCFKKTKPSKFSKKTNISYPLIRTRM